MIQKSGKFTFDEVVTMAMRYCAYQERCLHELRLKNQEWGLEEEEFEKLVDQLKEENFLKEERYVEMFVKGKFEHKGWGKNKIRHALFLKGIDQELTNQALEAIPEEQYLQCIQQLLQRKMFELRIDDPNRKAKLFNYLQSKGYETEIFYEILLDFLKEN